MSCVYAELHCISNFSFLRGASHAEELAARAAELGYAALAVTDECSMAGAVRAHVAAKEAGLKLIIGSEFRLEDGLRLVLLAQNRAGYGQLCALITQGRRAARKGSYRLTRDDLGQDLAHCLALWLPGDDADASDARWIAERFPGRAWIAAELLARAGDRVRLARLEALGRETGLPLVAAGDVHMHLRVRRTLQDTLTAIRLGVPVAKAGHALHPNGERHLRRRETLERIYPRALLEETIRIAERCDFSLDSLRYEYPEEIVPAGETPASYLRRLVEEGLRWRFEKTGPSKNTGLRTESKGLSKGKSTAAPLSTQHSVLSTRSSLSPQCSVLSFHSVLSTQHSVLDLPAAVPVHVRSQIEHELKLISDLGYEPYFLTVYDIVRFARSRGILCQGRGSAANSAVCYALGITEVDPGRMQMLFERFISKERNEPPDIDVDFEHQRREEVIQYLYGKYGRERAALAATVITYRSRSAFRDVGKALGLDLAQIDRISKSFAWWDRRNERAQRLHEAGFDPDTPVIRRLIALTDTLIGFPRHLSQHVGGFVISRGPLPQLVPVENAAMEDRTIIQWDKDDLDALGLLKVDVLALGMLSAIRRALDLVGQVRGRPFGMADVPPEDPQVYAMLQKADSIGVFQIESRAQMSMLPRLKPETYYDLVIEVAIVRPGPIQGGMVHPYLRRRQKLEPVTYPSEDVKKVLERTLGVPIFQEQVMQLAIVAAGFTPGEADRLRRSMAAWKRKGGLQHFEERLKRGMAEHGYTAGFADQIFRQILGFGEYGFPESHSASFALLVYVSAWLKCHEPAAFTCALLNSQPMGFYAPAQLVQDAQRHGVEVRGVDVFESEWECSLETGLGKNIVLRTESKGLSKDTGLSAESKGLSKDTGLSAESKGLSKGKDTVVPLSTQHSVLSTRSSLSTALSPAQPAIRLGFRMVNGLSEAGAQQLIEARAQGEFDSIEALLLRAGLSRKDRECLAAAGAFASTAGHRRNAAWLVAGIEARPELLRDAPIRETAADLPAPGEGQDIVADYASLGLTLGRHPLALLRPRLQRLHMSTAEELLRTPHGRTVRTAGLVTCRQRPGTASGVIFVTLEDETGHINVVVWNKVSERQRRPLLAARLLGVHGVLQREGEVVHLIAGRLVDHSGLLGTLLARSRDFH
ncbi:MAG: error-prone DNA polymerase [Burkholderiales bacterium]